MMDETFIKMCVAARDILRPKWVPKAGDRVLTKWGSDENKIEIDYFSKNFVTKEASVLLHKHTDIWLPRQEDLQSIYKQIKELSFDCCYKQFKKWDAFRYQFNEFEHNFDAFNIFETGSWNVLWLCFVMETCYNKTWNGKSWTLMED